VGLFQLRRRRKRRRTRRSAPRTRTDAGRDLRPDSYWNRLTFNESESDSVYHPPKVPELHPLRVHSMNVRSSCRWFREWGSTRAPYPIPLVCSSGKFSGSTLCFWKAYPEQISASLSSTVYSRLSRIVGRRHGWRYMRRNRELLFKIAAFYTVTHIDYYLDRFLGIFKQRSHGAAQSLLCWLLSRLGDNLRFVYNQICSQISWLTFRSKWIRDKPSNDRRVSPHPSLDSMRAEPGREDSRLCGNPFRLVASTWKTISLRSSYGSNRTRSRRSSGSLEIMTSETYEEYGESEATSDSW